MFRHLANAIALEASYQLFLQEQIKAGWSVSYETRARWKHCWWLRPVEVQGC